MSGREKSVEPECLKQVRISSKGCFASFYYNSSSPWFQEIKSQSLFLKLVSSFPGYFLGYRLIGSHSGVKLCRWTKVSRIDVIPLSNELDTSHAQCIVSVVITPSHITSFSVLHLFLHQPVSQVKWYSILITSSFEGRTLGRHVGIVNS